MSFMIFSFSVGSYFCRSSLIMCIGPQESTTMRATRLTNVKSMTETSMYYWNTIMEAM